MVLSIKRFGTVIVGVGIVLFLIGLLAIPAEAQNTSVDGNQYTDKVCDAVIIIVADNSADSEQNQEATSGGNTLNNDSTQGTSTGDNNGGNNLSQGTTTGNNVNEIAQELNVSPSIVQNCIKGNIDKTADANDIADEKGVINIPPKLLPDTGGFPPLLAVGFFLIAGAGPIDRRSAAQVVEGPVL